MVAVLVMPLVLGSLGMRAETGLNAWACLMVCTFPGKVLLVHSQCQSAPSLRPESAPGPLPGSDRGGPPEKGHWLGRPLDAEVGGQSQGKSMHGVKNDWLVAEVCKEAPFVASHHGEGKQVH